MRPKVSEAARLLRTALDATDAGDFKTAAQYIIELARLCRCEIYVRNHFKKGE